MNMFISTLTDVFADVQADVLSQDNDYEIVDFILQHFKGKCNPNKQMNRFID